MKKIKLCIMILLLMAIFCSFSFAKNSLIYAEILQDIEAPFIIVEKDDEELVVNGWEKQLFELNSSIISNTKSLKYESDEVIGGTIKSISADGWACTDEDGQVKLEESLDATTKVKVAPFDQGTNIITLPEVKFGEEYDTNLKISVTITVYSKNNKLGSL